MEGVCVGAVTDHGPDEAVTTLALILVGIVASIPGSLLTGALIKIALWLVKSVSKTLRESWNSFLSIKGEVT